MFGCQMQYDLLELRDAHAKLRTTNEKFRRERERHDKDRDEQRHTQNVKKRQDADEERKVNALLEQVEEFMRLAPDLFPAKQDSSSSTLNLPSAPNRTRVPELSDLHKSCAHFAIVLRVRVQEKLPQLPAA
jgi:MICOS complex subunit MIC60